MSNREIIPSSGILSADYPTCPFRNIISRFGDKWSLLILYVLSTADGSVRFSQLERNISDISSRVLSSCLRTLEADALVKRTIYPEVPPRVEYSLTEVGESLIPHLIALTNWAVEHFDTVIAHRAQFLSARSSTKGSVANRSKSELKSRS